MSEAKNEDRAAAARAIEAFLRALGRDPAREPQLQGTAQRVADAYLDELCVGYAVDTDALLSAHTIEAAQEASLESVVALRDILVTTMCPHHLMPASGVATIAFAPRGKIIGLGALASLVDAFAHRLILQEEIGERAVGALVRAIDPWWAGCRLVLSHTCVTARGERRHGARAETVALAGVLDAERRAQASKVLGVGE